MQAQGHRAAAETNRSPLLTRQVGRTGNRIVQVSRRQTHTQPACIADPGSTSCPTVTQTEGMPPGSISSCSAHLFGVQVLDSPAGIYL